MSIDTLQQRGLFHHKFKYVGFVLSGLCLLYALGYHLIQVHFLFSGLHIPHVLFATGLFISISSEEASEDERVRRIRSYLHTGLSAMFIVYILLQEIEGEIESMLGELSAILSIYLVSFHLIYRYDTEWIERNRGLSFLILLVMLVGFSLLYEVLWSV